MRRKKSKLPLFITTTVITPALIICILGFYLVSRQKMARLADVKREYTSRLLHVSNVVENWTRQLVEIAFQMENNRGINDGTSTALLGHIKHVLLKNPIVKYPFFINSRREYLFPFSRKTVLPESKAPIFKGKGLKPRVKERYLTGYRLEYGERNLTGAIKAYLKSLAMEPVLVVKPYIYYSIARCYFKLKWFPQAAAYYRLVQLRFPAIMKDDEVLNVMVLRHLALCSREVGNEKEALNYYLRLYEETLTRDAPGKTNPFDFYRNEALDYLNRNIRQVLGEIKLERVNRTGAVERIQESSALDISLDWHFFETGLQEESTGREDVKLVKLRDLYESSDEKTMFYKEVKYSDIWHEDESLFPGGFTIKRIKVGIPPRNLYLAYGPVQGRRNKLTDKPESAAVYFGFLISPEYIRAEIVDRAMAEHFEEPSVTARFAEPGEPGLISSFFQGILAGKSLTLLSTRDNFFETVVMREIRLYYLLLALLTATFGLGILLYYKYLARERDLLKLKARFVDSASHTLKTPLTRISLLVENMARGWITDGKKKEEFYNTILAETGRMGVVLDNMLNFSRIEAGKQFYEPELIYLQDVVNTVLEEYAGYLEQGGFETDVHIEDELPAVMMDPGAARLIIGNLVQNSIKYSLKKRRIDIRLYSDKHTGRDVVLEVRDHGIGIPEKSLPHIFEEFSRVPDETVKSIEGSGLGLFLVYHVVDAHNGRIEVKSTVGEGTTITVNFQANVQPKRVC
jgi:signal transduction histidine kinase/tetratricopeptide (TPR) repeat protein